MEILKSFASTEAIKLKTLIWSMFALVGVLATSCEKQGTSNVERSKIEAVQILAGQGDAEAQYNLGECYRLGEGVGEDLEEAFGWYDKSAKQNYWLAMVRVAESYRNGKGVPMDLGKAISLEKASFLWLMKQVEKDENPKNQSRIGWCFINGRGVLKDPVQALEWFRKSAKQGDSYSQHGLGMLHYQGVGVERNEEKAFYWFEKAATQGDANSQHHLGLLYYRGGGVEKDEEKAFYWFEKAATQGNASSQYMLGWCYSKGVTKEQDFEKAFKWLAKSAEQGNSDAQYELGELYSSDAGMRDYKKAGEWRRKAAEGGSAQAQLWLGKIYLSREPKIALSWYKAAAEQGYPKAQYELAELYFKGDKVLRDLPKSIELFERAANQGYVKAQYRMGNYYQSYVPSYVSSPSLYTGRLAPSEEEKREDRERAVKAFMWYILAANNGHAEAQYEVGKRYYYGFGIQKDRNEAKQWIKKAHENGLEAATKFWKNKRLWEE
jgi:TPR repeat protein